MYSGKSTELLRRIRRYMSIGKKCVLLNHTIDARGQKEVLCHTTDRMDAIKIQSIGDMTFSNDVDVIGIDEAQFFPDIIDSDTNILHPILNKMLNQGVTIIVAGLHTDFRAQPFKQVIGLIPYASDVEWKTALCSMCSNGTPASFSKKICGDTNKRIDSGADDKYRAVCRMHFLE